MLLHISLLHINLAQTWNFSTALSTKTKMPKFNITDMTVGWACLGLHGTGSGNHSSPQKATIFTCTAVLGLGMVGLPAKSLQFKANLEILTPKSR